MTAITFPNNPSSGDTHTAGNGIVYTYDGEKWTSIGTNSAGTWTRSGTEVSLTNAGDDLNVDSGTLFVDASTDRVGIGTSSPNTNLEIGTASGSNTSIKLNSSTNDYLEFSSEGTIGYIIAGHPTTGSGQLGFKISGGAGPVEAARIDSSGNVGVGTSSPSSKFVVSNGGNEGFEVVPASASDLNVFYNYNRNTSAYIDSRNLALSHQFWTGSSSSEAMRINSSGNVGVGTTSINNKFVIASSGSTPAYFHSVNASTGTSGNDGIVMGMGDATNAYFWNYESGSIVFATNATERMRLDSSGRLGIGTTSPAANLEITPGTGAGTLLLNNASGSTTDGALNIEVNAGGVLYESRKTGGLAHIWYTAGAERMRIDQNGATKCSTSTSLSTRFSGNIYHLSHNHNNGNVAHIFENSGNSTPYGIYVQFSGASPDNNTQYFISCEDTSSQRFYVWSDGDVVNHDNSYGAISDVKLKQDIVDSGSQWDDLKNLRVRKFKFKSDVEAYGDEAKTLIGLVAQEAELVSPGLVKESPDTDSDNNDLGTTTKSVNYSVLYMKAVKALQEAMERIETLEQRLSDAGIA